MKTILFIGTFDIKEKEYQYLRKKIEDKGVHPLLMELKYAKF
jgi:uncharacterized protein (UPF0261 family)